MHEGVHIRLYEGTIVTCQRRGYARDVRGSIIDFDRESNQWRVRLADNNDVLVPESALTFCHCLLPASLDLNEIYVPLEFANSQGTCGRGLIVSQAVKAGAPILQEAPFILGPSTNGDTSTREIKELHAERWLAIATLAEHAKCERTSGCSDAWQTMLSAFEELTNAAQVSSHVRAGASYTCSRHARRVFAQRATNVAAGSASSTAGGPLAPTPAQMVTDVLMRFSCNQFRISLSAQHPELSAASEPDHPGLVASALYAFISRVNHSCDPTMAMTSKELFCAARGMPFDIATDGGVAIAYAKRDLQPGEALTFNYCGASMATDEWSDVVKRRAFLWEKMGFVCGCERCVSESARTTIGRQE